MDERDGCGRRHPGDGDGQCGAGRNSDRSVTVVGARAFKRMNMPGAGTVTVAVGEDARHRNRPVMAVGLAPMAMGEMSVAESAMPVTVRTVPVAVTVDGARVAVMPVGARMQSVGVQVEPVCVPAMSVGVPHIMRPGVRCRVGMGHREEGHERAEREPSDRVAATAVFVMEPPPRLRGTGERDHRRESECGTSHHVSSARVP